MEKEYRACESVVAVIKEENTRLKINNKDLKAVIDLTDPEVVKSSEVEKPEEESLKCKECEYSFNDQLQIHS